MRGKGVWWVVEEVSGRSNVSSSNNKKNLQENSKLSLQNEQQIAKQLQIRKRKSQT